MKKIEQKIVGYEVVVPGKEKESPRQASGPGEERDPNERLLLRMPRVAVTASLRSPKRPRTPDGCDGRVYYIRTDRHKFFVVVSHLENGVRQAFEVLVTGAEQPRGLGAIAKILSADMRQTDRNWIFHKLDMLAKTAGEPCEVEVPGKGPMRFPSVVAAFAAIVRHRLLELGDAPNDGPSPALDALYFRKEPKAKGMWRVGSFTDVLNPSTGDDFTILLKELELPGEFGLPFRHMPFSIWMDGVYPETFTGFCKLLSKDMQVADPLWIALKLDALRDYKEANSAFWATVPGGGKQQMYPSTEAYVAALVAHRYQELGILDADWQPVTQLGLLEGADNVVPLRAEPQGRTPVVTGKVCNECKLPTVVKRDGCEVCTSCGALGDCG